MEFKELINNLTANIIWVIMLPGLTFVWRLLIGRFKKHQIMRITITVVMIIIGLFIIVRVWGWTGLIVTAVVVVTGIIVLFSCKGAFLWIGWEAPSSLNLRQLKETIDDMSAYARQPVALVADFHAAHVLATDREGHKGCDMELYTFIRLLEVGVESNLTEDVTNINTVNPLKWGNSNLDNYDGRKGNAWEDMEYVPSETKLTTEQRNAWNYFLKQAKKKREKKGKLRIRRILAMNKEDYDNMINSTNEEEKKCWQNFVQCHKYADIELSFLNKDVLPLKVRDSLNKDTHFFWESKGKSGWQLTGTMDTDLDRAHDVFITTDNASLKHKCSDFLKDIFANTSKITPEEINKHNEMPTQFKKAIGLIS